MYYDSPRSLTPKLLLADERGLAGAGFWAIGYERGVPGYTELISTFPPATSGRREPRSVTAFELPIQAISLVELRPPS